MLVGVASAPGPGPPVGAGLPGKVGDLPDGLAVGGEEVGAVGSPAGQSHRHRCRFRCWERSGAAWIPGMSMRSRGRDGDPNIWGPGGSQGLIAPRECVAWWAGYFSPGGGFSFSDEKGPYFVLRSVAKGRVARKNTYVAQSGGMWSFGLLVVVLVN